MKKIALVLVMTGLSACGAADKSSVSAATEVPSSSRVDHRVSSDSQRPNFPQTAHRYSMTPGCNPFLNIGLTLNEQNIVLTTVQYPPYHGESLTLDYAAQTITTITTKPSPDGTGPAQTTEVISRTSDANFPGALDRLTSNVQSLVAGDQCNKAAPELASVVTYLHGLAKD